MILPRHPNVSAYDAVLQGRLQRKPEQADAIRARFLAECGWTLLPALGYWRIPLDPLWLRGASSTYIQEAVAEDKLPEPQDFVDSSWDAQERAHVAAYLRMGASVARWLGVSRCRICGQVNGSTCLSDGAYVWPEGFAHYLEAHAVRPPSVFVHHVLSKLGGPS